MTFLQLEKMVKKDGWYYVDTKGSHKHFCHSSKKGKLTIPKHKGDMPIGTLRAILKQAQIVLK